MRKLNQAVAVTGMGIISSVGKGISNFRQALFHGQSNFTRLDFPKLSFPLVGAVIDSDIIIEKSSRNMPRHIQLALTASCEAWQQAAINQIPLDSTRIGLIVAGQNTTNHYQYQLQEKFQQHPEYLTPSYAMYFMDTDHVGRLSEAFGIRGEGFTVGGATASGNVALLRAYQLIRDGWQDACLVVGAAADLSPMDLQGFYNIGALGGEHFAEAPHKACRPFDEAHEGFIYGQAAAALVLESIKSASQRKIPILGYILGGALHLHANHLPTPNQEGEGRSMRQAMHVAGITSADIDYLNAHGTSSPLGDKIEIAAIEDILGSNCKNVIINSTKSIAGHCLWSAGVVEAIATLIQMQDGFVHPNLNLENPITKNCRLAGKESEIVPINIALSNSFGFGGINSTLVLSKDIT